MSKRTCTLVLCLGALVYFVCHSAFGANVWVSGWASGGPPGNDYESFNEPSSTTAFGVAMSALANSNAFASAKRLRAVADAHRPQGNPGAADGTAQANSTNLLRLLTTQLPNGSSCVIRFRIKLTGTQNMMIQCPQPGEVGSAWSLVDAVMQYQSDGTIIFEEYGYIFSNLRELNDPLQTGVYTGEIVWVNGNQVPVTLYLSADARCAGYESCTMEAFASLGHSFTWMGIESVRDMAGNPITDYTFTDDTGMDWKRAAHEFDLTGDDLVGVPDLLEVINGWGPCPNECAGICVPDTAPPGGDCQVGVPDLLALINNWGS